MNLDKQMDGERQIERQKDGESILRHVVCANGTSSFGWNEKAVDEDNLDSNRMKCAPWRESLRGPRFESY